MSFGDFIVYVLLGFLFICFLMGTWVMIKIVTVQ